MADMSNKWTIKYNYSRYSLYRFKNKMHSSGSMPWQLHVN